MMIAVCDGCGKRLSVWVTVETNIGAAHDYANIIEVQNFQHRRFHFCGDCAERLLKEKAGKE